MVCLGLEPGAAGLKAQTKPLSYGSTLLLRQLLIYSYKFHAFGVGTYITDKSASKIK